MEVLGGSAARYGCGVRDVKAQGFRMLAGVVLPRLLERAELDAVG